MVDQVRYPIRLRPRMLPSDAFFWYAEEAIPELRPQVGALLMLDRAPDRSRFHAAIQRLTLWIPRLRERVGESPLPFGLPEWEEDPAFELDYHVRDVALPEPATLRHLLEFAGAVFATPLDPLRPLWEAYLIEGLEQNRAALFFKGHHCLVDGVGSLALFEALTQAHRSEPVRFPRAPQARPPSHPAERWLRSLRYEARDLGSDLAATAESAWGALMQPVQSIASGVRMLLGVRGMARDLMPTVIRDPLAQRCTGIGRRLDALELSLPRMQLIREAVDATLNELVLAVLAGALGRYYEERGCPVDELHCIVPVNLRREDEIRELGNRVGVFSVLLPVGVRDPLLRLEIVRKQSRAARSEQRGTSYPILLQLVRFAPGFVFRALARNAAGRVNLICTNVPGPRMERFLAGAKVEAIYPFAPVMLRTPLSLALLSYADRYELGIDTDPGAIPDPRRLHRLLDGAVAEIEQRVLPRRKAQPQRNRRRRGKAVSPVEPQP